MGFRNAFRGLSFFLFLLAPAIAAAEQCAPDKVSIRGDWGTAVFDVELADTAAERSQGLMFRQSMPKSSGMLFIYPHPQRVSFWMRNTPLPLDMIFVDQTGTVKRIHENAIPFDDTSIHGGRAILAVLEINAGLSETFGFSPGDEMQHPAFDPSVAVWPCLD